MQIMKTRLRNCNYSSGLNLYRVGLRLIWTIDNSNMVCKNQQQAQMNLFGSLAALCGGANLVGQQIGFFALTKTSVSWFTSFVPFDLALRETQLLYLTALGGNHHLHRSQPVLLWANEAS